MGMKHSTDLNIFAVPQSLPPKRTIDRSLIAGLGLLVLLLTLNASLAYRNTWQLREDAHWVAHTHEMLDLTGNVLVALLDAETGQRGFIITGEDAFLQPYQAAVARWGALMAQLNDKAKDSPGQQARIKKLEEMATRRLALANESIVLRRRSAQEATSFLAAGEGKAQMDAIRLHIGEMENIEEKLLQDRKNNTDVAYRIAVTTGLLTAVLGLLTVWAFVRLLNRSLARREEDAAVIAEQRERLRTTLASIGDAVISTDIAGRITNMNAVAESLTGWKSSEAAGEPLDTIFHIVNEETRQQVQSPATRALQEGVIVGLANHTVLIAKDGAERHIDDSAAPIRCKDGEIVGCVLIFRDISERRALEKQNVDRLADARFLASIVESSEDAIISKSLDGIIRSWNAAAERVFGYSATQAIGQHVSLLIPAERAEEEDLIIGRIRAGTRVEHFQTVRVRNGGDTIAVSLTVSPIKDDAGQVIGASKIVRDITAQKQAEREIAESQARKAAILDTALDCIIICDHEGKIIEFNPAAEQTFGHRREDVVGREMSEIIIPPSLRLRHRQGMERFVKTGQSHILGKHLTLTGLRADGGEFPVEFAVTQIPSDGQPVFTAYLRDITERKRMEDALNETANALRKSTAELSEADRRKNEFLAMLAHELRNPLAPIHNAVQVLRLGGNTAEVIRSATALMERQVGQLIRLVDDLLDVSRISRGKIELREETVELASVVHQAVEAARPLCEQMHHDLTVSLPSLPIYLNADPARLAQVVGNLLTNACKFTNGGGRISLAVDQEDAQAVIRVRDTGIGIAADQLPRIFEMFTQLDTSLERSQSGLGIGLTLVRNLIELHGGTVTAHSDGLGQGTEFEVRLPITNETRATSGPSVIAPTPGTNRRILIVDDNHDSVASLASLLTLSGYAVHTAYDGLQATEAAETLRPDVVLLDIGLPKLNGYEVARKIREQPWGKDIGLVALTGWGQDEDRKKSQEAGFDGHLVKPVDYASLIKLLASFPTCVS